LKCGAAAAQEPEFAAVKWVAEQEVAAILLKV